MWFGLSLGFRTQWTYSYSQSSLETSTPFTTSLVISGLKRILKRPVWLGSYSAFGPTPVASLKNSLGRRMLRGHEKVGLTHTIKSGRPHSVPTSLVNSGLKQYWNNQCSSVHMGLSVRSCLSRQHAHNQIWRPHSVPMSLVVSGLNQYWNNQCSSVRTGLSVRTLGARACASWSRKLVPRHCSGDQPTTNTQSNLETSLCSYITGHFRINTFSFKKKVQSNHGVGTALSLKGNSRRHACEDNINTWNTKLLEISRQA